MFVQRFTTITITGNIKAPHHWPFVRRIHWWPMDSPHKGPVIRYSIPPKQYLMGYCLNLCHWFYFLLFCLIHIICHFSRSMLKNIHILHWHWGNHVTVTRFRHTTHFYSVWPLSLSSRIYTGRERRWPRWTWWRHQMKTFSALLALCAGNSPVTDEFPSQRPVTQSFQVFFDLRLNKRLSK